MSGMESNESFIFPREKEKRHKVLLNVKIFLALLLSNTLTLFLFIPRENEISVVEKFPRKGFQLIELPLKNFTRASGIARATLFKGTEVVLHDVAIHHHLSRNSSPTHYLLEVSKKDLPGLIQYKGLTLSAFPYGNYPFKKKPSNKRLSYEIRF